AVLHAQEKEDRTLLNWDQMRAIIMEASGERAMHHVLEFVPYQRVRPASHSGYSAGRVPTTLQPAGREEVSRVAPSVPWAVSRTR
ncbi:MAG: hypothetical protein EBT89_11565, partial [Opitutaceae bacterium]|nr:hypothetical protein [Opitutaceae bacterium]